MRYLAFSRRWVQDHGITRKDIRGYCHYDILPDLPERWLAVHARCLAGAIERCDEDSFIGADGQESSPFWPRFCAFFAAAQLTEATLCAWCAITDLETRRFQLKPLRRIPS